jgi:hypothetical protein
MGRVGAEPQPGVLFLTSAGGGAPLYRCIARDYVAREKAVWHFTLFEFSGDEARLSATDLAGTVIDSYLLTKKPTPPDEYAAFEIEEIRQFLRVGLGSAAPARLAGAEPTNIDAELRIPTRFKVPVEGELIWKATAGWKLGKLTQAFKLQPGEPLVIPLQAVVAAGPFPQTPELTIRFAPGKFCNRTIVVSPFKLTGPEDVQPERIAAAVTVDGLLTEDVWKTAPSRGLLAVPSHAGRADEVQFAADDKFLYVGARLDDPTGKVRVVPAEEGKNPWSRAVQLGEHFRVVVHDGKKSRTFAVSPTHVRWADADGKEDAVTEWQAAVAPAERGWNLEMKIPREAFSTEADLRINTVHRQGSGSWSIDYELCPTYSMGSDPDLLPDWKSGSSPASFARLKWSAD